ncbi:MAG: Polyprenol monophosphomannose synthase [Phycisphaerae bacterium]|nr:Polyprenol monophosphomannose synthase [Phycisphaerae bacterium]
MSVIVPTCREAANLEELVRRLFTAIRGSGWDAELIVVDDDSRDGTTELVERLRREFDVRCITRVGRRGLSTAVIEGLDAARHEVLVVMDADLQHPPELVPILAAAVEEGGADFVLASRYTEGGGIAENWSWVRRLASRTACLLARGLTRVSDPMSGFFALPRKTYARAAVLSPIGYKIALELIVKCGSPSVAEIPFRFDLRRHGESKFSLREQVNYARHLMRLYAFRHGGKLTAVVTALILLSAVLAVIF